MATQILLIEDEVQIRENVAELLSLHGFDVVTASDGRQGISQAMLHPPDLILCDIMMPEVDGYQVLNAIRGSRLVATVPFIFLTAKTDPMDLRTGMNLGADDYLTKPFTLQNLLTTIESRLAREASRKTTLKAQVEQYRYRLTSMAVHEYNTPLSGIIGISTLLLDQYQGLDEKDTLSFLEMIKVSGLRLKRSLDNVQLTDMLQQIDSSHTDYRYFSSGDSAITTALVDSYMMAVAYRQDRKIGYQLEVESAQICISENNLKLCLEELVDNAFKFSNSDQTVTLTGKTDASGYRITVTNTGQPFKAEHIALIAPYMQFDRKQYEQQGFGLGLSITKKIIELNKGQLTIESPSAGITTAIVWLPRVL